MRVIVTGGSGFIGSHVVDLLLSQRNTVLVIDNFSTGKMENISKHALENNDLMVCDCDITRLPELMGSAIAFKPDAIIHLAAQAAITTALENPVKDIFINGVGTLNVLRAAEQTGVKRFVFSSTSAVYKETSKKVKETSETDPANPYGISKLAAEKYIRVLHDSPVILRYGNVYGPRQVPIGENQVVARMIRHFKYGDEFYIHGNGKQKRDFVYVKDVAEATVTALRGNPGTYNIASGHSFSVNEIASFMEEAYDVPGYHWDHTGTNDPRQMVQMDVRSANAGLGWKPKTPIKHGIFETVKWWEDA